MLIENSYDRRMVGPRADHPPLLLPPGSCAGAQDLAPARFVDSGCPQLQSLVQKRAHAHEQHWECCVPFCSATAQVKPSVYLGPRGVHRTLVNRDGLHLQVGLPRAQREAWNHCGAVLSLKQAWVEALCWPESCGRGGVAMKRPRQAGQHLPAAVLWDPART